jgi:EAL domain-containing protein (putative c-di-GMP-specific phosphodiesterase class I)/GGDEF domain-containing protein
VTDSQTQRETQTLTSDDASGLVDATTMLSNVRPLDVLIIRKRYGWLLGDFEHRVRIHFQPILDLNAEGRIFAYEALCRLADPMGPLLAGGQAFALARAAGRAGDLDVACQSQALARKAAGIARGVAVFLNVLPQNLLQARWRQGVVERMDELGIDHKDVVIEVVESEQADPMELAAACDDLRRADVRIALDDIGAGFNGLSTLAAVRSDFIKIDRGLVHQAQRSRVRTVLMEALVSMAQRLGTRVIAEGLERPEDIMFCREMAIGYAQGYYFAMPTERPAVEVTPLPPRLARTAMRSMPRVDLTQLMESAPSLDISESQEAARRLFREQAYLPSVVLTDSGYPVGLLHRGVALSPAAISLGKASKPIRHILPAEVSPAALARWLFQGRREEDPWIVISREGRYLGNVAPAMLAGSLMTQRSGGDEIHPLSQLPTGPGLRHVLENRLAGARPCVLVYIDLDHFKAYNDRYGFVRGDAMIRLLSELLRHAFVDRPELYLGHIGGDDFVLIAEADDEAILTALRAVIARFRSLALRLYDESDVRRGYFVTDVDTSHPIANVSVAVVNGSTGLPATAAVAAERAAALKKVAKGHQGSVMVKEGHPPVVVHIGGGEPDNRWEENAISALDRIASQPRKADPHLLDADFANYPYFEVVFELDDQGVQRYPNWLNPEMYGRIKAGGQGMDRAHQSYFRSVMASGLPYVSPIYLSSATEDFCLTVASPVSAAKGQAFGVLVADINISSLAEWAMKNAAASVEPRPETGEARQPVALDIS